MSLHSNNALANSEGDGDVFKISDSGAGPPAVTSMLTDYIIRGSY